MAIKSILCAYSGDAAKGSGLRHAIKLAKHHNANLTGVLKHGAPGFERLIAPHIPSHLVAELHRLDIKHAAEISERFMSAASDGGLADRASFVEIDPQVDGALSEFAHAFDLIVTGVHTDAAHEAHMSAHPDLLALRSGRPVLVVPDGYQADGLADRAHVAWDGKRAATRAIADAIPILSEKSSVTLLSVGRTPRGTDRMVANLTQHDVEVTARTVNPRGTVAESILADAAAADAKLIVMGAFEHSKFSHDLFGGVTTEIVATATVPVFMAH